MTPTRQFKLSPSPLFWRDSTAGLYRIDGFFRQLNHQLLENNIGHVDVLTKIKRLALARRIVFTAKAEDEMYCDGLVEDEIIESIVRARRIDKTIRSTSVYATGRAEKLYVIKGYTFANVLVYTKGKIVRDDQQETFYVLISSKRSI